MALEKQSGCKINLLLNILGKRPDGFHELETIMHPVALHDCLRLEPGGFGIKLSCSEPSLPTDSRNLVVRAAENFFAAAGIAPGVSIYLEKNLPVAAGLGGGSANAAITFLGLNELFGSPLSHARLGGLASELGSDVPFFLQSKPALCTGRGEKIEPVDFFPALGNVYLLLVHPGFGISTPWAYQQLARFPAGLNGERGRAEWLLGRLREPDLSAAGRGFYNALEFPALEKYPLLALYQNFFRAQGAEGTLMSGSGSTTFALFRNEAAGRAAEERFRDHFGAEAWLKLVPLGREAG